LKEKQEDSIRLYFENVNRLPVSDKA